MTVEDLRQPGGDADSWKIASESLSQNKTASEKQKKKEMVESVRLWAISQDEVLLLRELCRGQLEVVPAGLGSSGMARVKIAGDPKTHLEKLRKALIEEFRQGDAVRDRLIIVARVIEADNRQHKLQLPIPIIPRKERRQSNPFKDFDALKAIRLMRELQRVEDLWTRQCKTQKVPAGLIALSAIVEGGLLHNSMVDVLMQRIAEPQCPIEWWEYRPALGRVRSAQPFIDLSLGWGATVDAELRRWFVDPQTASLIVRAYQDYQAQGQNPESPSLREVWSEFRSAFGKHAVPQELRPKTLNKLLSEVRVARFSDNYPSLVVNYCGRRLVCHSVRRSTLPRLAGNRLLSPPPKGKEFVEGLSAAVRMPVKQRPDELNESKWYSDLLLGLNSGEPSERVAKLNKLACSGRYPPAARRIMEFASFKIVNDSAAGKPFALSTVENYTSLVARFLGGLLGGDDPKEMPTEQLVSLYHESIDAADQGRSARATRRHLARALLEFHDFLVRKYGKQGVDTFAVFGAGRDLVPVDANVLTPDEYSEVRKLLETPKRDRRLREIALILLSLGYWLGLRREEARGLRTIDVCNLGLPMLLIRPWDRRGLKTANATRALPLSLLPEEEFERLQAWKRTRQGNSNRDDSQFLFGIRKQDREVVTVKVFRLVQAAMVRVTGDHTLRYHHLRHSCASFAFLRLCLADFRNAPSLFPRLPKTTELLLEAPLFRALIYRTPPVECSELIKYDAKDKDVYALAGPIRQHAFAVAQLLGHADPSTTLENYIHFVDLVLPLYRRSSEFFALPRESAIRASGYPRSTGFRSDVEDLPAKIWRKLPDRLKRIAPDSQVSIEHSQLPAAGVPWIDRVCEMLKAAATERRAHDELAAEYGLTKPLVDALFARACALRDMRDGSPRHQFRHPMAEWTPDPRDPESIVRLPCPDRPDSPEENAIISRLEGQIPTAIDLDRAQAKRALEYLVRNQKYTGRQQKNVRPLFFEDPDDPQDARDYLAFLESLGLQRLEIERKDGKGISRQSEIRFIWYDAKCRRRWGKSLGKEKRDVYWHDMHKASPQRLGILAHLGVVPDDPLVGSAGFCFAMQMAWIAWPCFAHSGIQEMTLAGVSTRAAE